MKCANCGSELREGCIYCSSCGKEAQIVADYNVLEDEYLNTLLESENQQNDFFSALQGKPPIDQKKVIHAPSRKRKSKKGALIGMILVIFILIAVMAAVSYVKIQTEQNNSFEYQVSKAEAAMEESEWETAVSYYKRALELEPENIKIRQTLADIYMDRNDYDSVLKVCREIIEIDSENSKAFERMIFIYDSRKDYDSIFALKKKTKNKTILKLFEVYEVSAPRFSMAEGEYQEYITVKLFSTRKHKIYYTINGKDPMEEGQLYEEEIKLDKMGEYRIQAVCVNEKGLYSDMITLTYIIDIPAPKKPHVTPEGGTYSEETMITITVPEGCEAYYNWNGTEPDTNSILYTEPFPVSEGNHVLSVIIRDKRTGKFSEVYQEIYMYYPQ